MFTATRCRLKSSGRFVGPKLRHLIRQPPDQGPVSCSGWLFTVQPRFRPGAAARAPCRRRLTRLFQPRTAGSQSTATVAREMAATPSMSAMASGSLDRGDMIDSIQVFILFSLFSHFVKNNHGTMAGLATNRSWLLGDAVQLSQTFRGPVTEGGPVFPLMLQFGKAGPDATVHCSGTLSPGTRLRGAQCPRYRRKGDDHGQPALRTHPL